jgi:metallo-beta-lactamase family protein
MASAGRVKHHIYHGIVQAENTILIVGFCAPGTLGARLLDKPEKINIFNHDLNVKARIEVLNSMSAHGDENEMVNFLNLQDKEKLKRIFLVHGIAKGQEDFRYRLLEEGYRDVYIPRYEEVVEIS